MPGALPFKVREYVWLAAAGAAAIVAATLPPVVVLGILFALFIVVSAMRTPFALLTVLLVVSPLRALLATEANLPLSVYLAEILLVVYFGAWLAKRVIDRRPPFVLAREPVLPAILLLGCALGIGAFASASLSAWLREWLKWLIMAAFVWQLSLSARQDWRWLVFALLLAAVANAVVGLYIFLGGSGADHLLIFGRFFRAFGTFGQPNPFGGFMGLLLPLALMGSFAYAQILLKGFQQARRPQRDSILLFSCFALTSILLFCALIASWSRGAWLGFAVSTAVMIFAIPVRISRGIAGAVALGILFAGMWYGGLVPRSIMNRLTTAAGDFFTIDDIRGVDVSPENFAVMERIAHWQAALNMAEARPLFGVGLGNYEVVYEEYRLINWKDALGHAHNLYLNMLAETGVAGALAYIAFWLGIFALTWRTRAHPNLFARCMAIGLLGCWTYLAVHSIFDNLYVNNLFLHLGVLLGMLSILHMQVRNSLTME